MCACSGTSSLAPVIKIHIYFIAFMERYLTPSEKFLAIGDVSCSSGRRHITAVFFYFIVRTVGILQH
jgi:hypothetical protein